MTLKEARTSKAYQDATKPDFDRFKSSVRLAEKTRDAACLVANDLFQQSWATASEEYSRACAAKLVELLNEQDK